MWESISVPTHKSLHFIFTVIYSTIHSLSHSVPIHAFIEKSKLLRRLMQTHFYFYFSPSPSVSRQHYWVLLGVLLLLAVPARPPILLFDFVILIIKLYFVLVIYSLQIFMCLNSTDSLFWICLYIPLGIVQRSNGKFELVNGVYAVAAAIAAALFLTVCIPLARSSICSSRTTRAFILWT